MQSRVKLGEAMDIGDRYNSKRSDLRVSGSFGRKHVKVCIQFWQPYKLAAVATSVDYDK